MIYELGYFICITVVFSAISPTQHLVSTLQVVGGTAMLLAALFMMWPLVEGSPHGYVYGAS